MIAPRMKKDSSIIRQNGGMSIFHDIPPLILKILSVSYFSSFRRNFTTMGMAMTKVSTSAMGWDI